MLRWMQPHGGRQSERLLGKRPVYGTMSDDEMRRMDVQVLQDDGVIFLWVTGRAMELGRECLDIWGYKFVQELL